MDGGANKSHFDFWPAQDIQSPQAHSQADEPDKTRPRQHGPESREHHKVIILEAHHSSAAGHDNGRRDNDQRTNDAYRETNVHPVGVGVRSMQVPVLNNGDNQYYCPVHKAKNADHNETDGRANYLEPVHFQLDFILE